MVNSSLPLFLAPSLTYWLCPSLPGSLPLFLAPSLTSWLSPSLPGCLLHFLAPSLPYFLAPSLTCLFPPLPPCPLFHFLFSSDTLFPPSRPWSFSHYFASLSYLLVHPHLLVASLTSLCSSSSPLSLSNLLLPYLISLFPSPPPYLSPLLTSYSLLYILVPCSPTRYLPHLFCLS